MILADTSFLIDLINSDPGAVAKAKDIDNNQIPVTISSITVQEYLRGIYYLFGDDRELLNRKMFEAESDLARFQVLEFDYELTKFAARIDAELTRKGNQIGYADVLIASTALAHNFRILTRNVSHFSRIQDLEIEEY